jgi:hypothetical protein
MIARLDLLAGLVSSAAASVPFVTAVIRVPEPSTASLLTTVAGAAGALHVGRMAVQYLKSKRH